MPFSDKTKYELSCYSGGYCSNPECVALQGIKKNPYVPSIGHAAHIVSESPNGPRGDSPLTLEQRNQFDNGIWLCPVCHGKIDGPRWYEYPVPLLKEWREAAHTLYQDSLGKKPFQMASPNIREQRSLPDAQSLSAAIAFKMLHLPLANALHRFRFDHSHQYLAQFVLPQNIESLIAQLSSRQSYAQSWQTEWHTTYRCVDMELHKLMLALLAAVDALLPASNVWGERIVVFNPPNELPPLISTYLDTFDTLSTTIANFTAL